LTPQVTKGGEGNTMKQDIQEARTQMMKRETKKGTRGFTSEREKKNCRINFKES
jgi:hypothetical protein